MYRGFGSDQHEKKNALRTSGYWIVAVIKGSTLSSPDKWPERKTDMNVNVPATVDSVQKRRRIAEVTSPHFLHVHCKLSTTK